MMLGALCSLIVLAVYSAAVTLPELVNSASPPPISEVRIPFRKHVNHGLVKHAAARDQARARAMAQRVTDTDLDTSAVESLKIINIATVYVAPVNVGSPATTFFLIVDTGSSNTWVGATTKFTPTNTTHALGRQASVQYASGFYDGQQILDQVAFQSPLTIPQQSLSVASRSGGFDGVDGILGLGPVDLTVGTVQNTSTVPTITDNLFGLGIIPARIVSMSFAPTNLTFDVNGELTFGGVDPTAFIGELFIFPITSASPANAFFGVDASIVQGTTTILSLSSGIFDAGSTLVSLSLRAFNSYVLRTGAVPDPTTGLLRVTPMQFAALPTLNIVIGGITFPLTPDAQRWPQQLNTAIGGLTDFVYLIVNVVPSGTGFNFILGQFFMERFYSVYDSSGFVGLAPTKFTNATVNN